MKLAGFDETSRATGSRFGGARGYWTEEAGEKVASTPKFRVIELNLHKLVGLCYATDELLQDANALEQAVRRAFTEEIAFGVDDAIINGTGTGQPLGVLNGGSCVQVDKESGQAAATVVTENIVKMWSRLLPKSQRTAVWLVNQDVMPQLFQLSMAVGTGGSAVFLPAGGLSSEPFATLFNRPIIPVEQCQTLGTAGDILLCDFAHGYVLCTKGGIEADVSMHVRFVYDESVFRFVMRVDGSPTLASAVTPYKGSATQSHFVKLQTRS
jgi:HK97 family phage major capsid protein